MRSFAFSRNAFHILVSLAGCDRHGHSIIKEIADRTGDAVGLTPSTIHSVIKRVLEEGLIEELKECPDPKHDDERRRYYRLTPAGKKAADGGARQLEKLLAGVGATGLAPKRA